jgi:apolipoprotein N-acyltransferase
MIVAQLRYAENPTSPISTPTSPIPTRHSPLAIPNLYQALTLFVGYTLVLMHVFPSELPTGIEAMVGLPIPVWVYVVLGVALVSLIFFVTGLPAGSMAFHRKTHFRFFLIAPAFGWMGLEQLRIWLQLGQSWARLPSTQHANLALIQLASLGGQWVIGLLVVMANYAIAWLIANDSWRVEDNGNTPTRNSQRAIRNAPFAIRHSQYAFVILTLIAVLHVVGYMLIANPTQTVRVAAVQLGSDLGDHPVLYSYWLKGDFKGMDDAVLAEFEPMIREAAKRGAKIIALPEAMLWNDPAIDLRLVARLTSLSKELGAYITFTFYLWNDPNSRNEVYMATPQGEWKGFYAKNHPIGYIGEYSITAGRYPTYTLVMARTDTFASPSEFASPVVFSNFVCYDNAYTDVALRHASNGVQLLTSANHDWPEGAWGFYTQSIYRAVENRLAIVRADWRVGSVIIDPYGRIVATTKWDEREKAVLVADVPIVTERGTVYMRYGDWLGYVSVGALGLMLLSSVNVPRRKKTRVS